MSCVFTFPKHTPCFLSVIKNIHVINEDTYNLSDVDSSDAEDNDDEKGEKNDDIDGVDVYVKTCNGNVKGYHRTNETEREIGKGKEVLKISIAGKPYKCVKSIF